MIRTKKGGGRSAFDAGNTRAMIEQRPGTGPAIVFLPGYASDMAGTKALAVDGWAAGRGHACTRFDYRGCGRRDGTFADFTLEDWRDDALEAIDATPGPVILIGSSMGGWLMLLAALARPAKVAGLIGIAAAPDFTDWGYDDVQRASFARGEDVFEPSPYGEPMLTTARFWASGQRHLLLDAAIAIDAPVRLIHGQCDADVPWETSLRIAERVRSADVQVALVKDGGHRLSRPQDIALLIATLEGLLTP
jgi:pimeloyl-ACP methyl ester carboxylesterase